MTPRPRSSNASRGSRSARNEAVPSSTRGGAPAQERKLRTQGRKTLRKLLDAGMVVFERRGYHAARVDDIVKVARTSHGTFYLYFANKEDLFQALLADAAQEMAKLSEQLGPISPSRAGYDELRTWLARFIELYRRYRPIIRAWTESEVPDTAPGEMGEDLLGGLVGVLTSHLEQSDLPPGIDPTVGAVAVVAMIERFSYYVASRDLKLDGEEALDTLTAILHVGLFGGSRRPRK
jgi:AcrR family transcriptional regulator